MFSAFAALCLTAGVLLAWLLRGLPQKTPAGLKPFHSIPGVPGRLPIFGNVFQVIKVLQRPQLHLPMRVWAETIGPLVRFKMIGLPNEAVIVTDVNLMEGIIGWTSPGLPKNDVYDLLNPVTGPKARRTIVTHLDMHKSNWRPVRKAIVPCFSAEAMRSKFPGVRAQAQQMAVRLAELGPECEVELEEAMARATMDVILESGNFGLQINALDFQQCEPLEHLQYCIADAFKCLVNPLRTPARRLLPFLPYAREYRHHIRELYAFWERMWISLEAVHAHAAPSNDLANALWRLQDPGSHPEGKAPLTREEAREEMAMVVLAGIDTTATQLAFALLNLACHPAAQQRVQQELQAAGLLQEQPQVSARQLQHADLSRLPYLDAVVKETLRLFPVIASGTGRLVDRPMRLGDYHIPSGVIMSIPQYAIQRSAKYFPRPDEFLPERWLTPEGKLEKAQAGLHFDSSRPEAAFKFQPFSVGHRNCPGRNLALMEVMTMLATILGQFHVHAAPRMGRWDDISLDTVIQLTLGLDDGIWIKFVPHVKQTA